MSDTHAKDFSLLGEKLAALIREADFVIHAGDADTFEFISELKKNSKELYAVRGNCDSGIDLPVKLLFEIEGVKIGLCHGSGNHSNVPERLNYLFYDDKPHIIIFGHTHIPLIGNIEGLTFINPGSPFKNRGLPYGTFCGIMIDKGKFEAKIIRTDTI